MNNAIEEYNFSTKKDDLFRCCRPVLIFGYFIGLFPISGLFQKIAAKLKFRKLNAVVILSIVTILWAVINIGVSLNYLFRTHKRNPSDIAWAASPLMFYIFGFCTFAYFLWNVKDLIRLFRLWNCTSISLDREDPKLYRDSVIIFVVICTSRMMENVIWHLKRFPVFDHAEVYHSIRFNISSEASPLEVFYYRGYAYWGRFVSYNTTLAMLLFTINKLLLYGPNVADVLLVIFSRAFNFKFKSLIDIGTLRLKTHSHDPEFWTTLISDHDKLCDLLKHFSDFMSPLVFLSYAANCYNTCLTLHQTLTPSANTSFGAALHAIYSLGHHIMVVLVVTLFAARLNDNAKGISDVFYQCPEKHYTKEVERSVRGTLSKSFIGFHGMHCFFVSKPLILSFISVVMTFEIVLLAATTTVTPKKPK